MKLQVTQENLNKALGSVARVANSRSTLPILSNVLLKTTNNRLSISATNLDIAITHFIGAKISSNGAITVPARLMQDFISSLPDGVLELELKDNKLHITTEKYNSTINGVGADEFPVMPKIEGGTSWKAASRNFKKALQQVTFAASSDDARPILTGVCVKSVNKQLYLVATDSYRLAEKQLQKTAQEVDLLVPAGAMQDLLRIIGDGEEEIVVTHDEQQVLFELNDVSLVARLIDGTYPDYKKLIPEKVETVAKLKRTDFINITKVSSLFARESAGATRMTKGQSLTGCGVGLPVPRRRKRPATYRRRRKRRSPSCRSVN